MLESTRVDSLTYQNSIATTNREARHVDRNGFQPFPPNTPNLGVFWCQLFLEHPRLTKSPENEVGHPIRAHSSDSKTLGGNYTGPRWEYSSLLKNMQCWKSSFDFFALVIALAPCIFPHEIVGGKNDCNDRSYVKIILSAPSIANRSIFYPMEL